MKYVEVTLIERRLLKVSIAGDDLPTPERMKEMLENEEVEDVTDDETLEIMSVETVVEIEQEDELED